MNYDKIGLFIKEKRKELNLTQKELASLLSITDKAISKWERGLGFPDVSLLEDLSNALNISILELIKGEKINDDIKIETENYVKETLSITNQENTRKKKILINKILSFIIIGTCLLILFLNIFQIIKLNKTYFYTINEYDKKILNSKITDIDNKYNIINNNKGKFTDNDYQYIIYYLNLLIKDLKNEDILKKDTITYKTTDLYMLEYKRFVKYTDNEIYNIIKILTNYTNDELLLSYSKLYSDTINNLTANDIMNNYTIANLTKYKLLDNNNYFNDNNYIEIKEKYISYKISNLIYIENLIIEAGDINE